MCALYHAQSTKDVGGLNHWCSSAVALCRMAEGWKRRLKRIWKAQSSAICLPTTLLNTWHVALRIMGDVKLRHSPKLVTVCGKWHVHLVTMLLLGCNPLS